MKINFNVIQYKVFVCFVILLYSLNSFSQEKVKARAVVDEVTVFMNAAEVSNKVNVALPKGTGVLVVQNVAQNIDLSSVRISGPDGIVILSTTQANQDDMEPVSPAHRKIKDSLEAAVSRREILINKQSAVSGALKILNKDELFGSGTKVDLVEISKLIDYYQTKVFELNTSLAVIKKNIESEDKAIRKLQEEMRSYSGRGGQLVIQMNNSVPVRGDLLITYITYFAGWQVYYDLRSKSITSPLEILYKAKVWQNTGVDWKNVKLSLSTGNPTQSGTAPILSPEYIRFYTPMTPFSSVLADQRVGLSTKAKNQADSGIALEEVTVAKAPRTSVVENQLNTTFDIEIPYDIVSNGKPHSVTLKEYSQPALYRYYAVPKVDKDVFLVSEITDFERLNLVPGEANVIFENMFVGTSFLNTNITTDTLNLSMGRDKSINIKRDRVMDAKSNQTSGSTRKQTYTYDIIVKNNKASAIDLMLKDQFPISTDKAIEIDLVDNGGATVNKETGLLTWFINIKPSETKTYRFTFVVKHPKDRTISFN